MDLLEPRVHSPVPGTLDSKCGLVGWATRQCVCVCWTGLPQGYACTYHALLVVLHRLLTKDPLVQEVNLGANLIGEFAALEILEGLKQRKEGRH